MQRDASPSPLAANNGTCSSMLSGVLSRLFSVIHVLWHVQMLSNRVLLSFHSLLMLGLLTRCYYPCNLLPLTLCLLLPCLRRAFNPQGPSPPAHDMKGFTTVTVDAGAGHGFFSTAPGPSPTAAQGEQVFRRVPGAPGNGAHAGAAMGADAFAARQRPMSAGAAGMPGMRPLQRRHNAKCVECLT